MAPIKYANRRRRYDIHPVLNPPRPGAAGQWGAIKDALTGVKGSTYHPGGTTLPGAPPSALNIPGYTPNWLDLINNDPALAQIRANLQGQGNAALSGRNAAAIRDLIRFGEIPTGINDYGLTDADRALIQQSTTSGLSTAAQLRAQHALRQRGLINQLGAAGIARSGETGYQTGQEQQAYTQEQDAARQAVLAALAGYDQTYLAGEGERAGQLNTAIDEATGRQMGLSANQPVAGQTATWNSGASLYVSPTGDLYQKDGTKVDKAKALAHYAAQINAARRAGRQPAAWVLARYKLLGG